MINVKEENEKVGLKLKSQKTKIMASNSIISWQIRWGNNGNSDRLYFGGIPNHGRSWLQPWNYKMLAPWKKSYDQPRQHIKKQRHYFADKSPSSQSYGFSSSHVWMWELDYKESWGPENRSFWTVVLEKTLQSPLDCKEIKPVNPKRNQHWILIGRSDAEGSILWSPDMKSWLTGKDSDAGKDWRLNEKRAAEAAMARQITDSMDMNLSKLRETVNDSGNLEFCSPWGHKELDMTEWLNNTLRKV